jgi:hypothetical protein
MKRKNKHLLLVVVVMVVVVFIGAMLFGVALLSQASLQLDINYVPIYSQQGVELNPVPSLYFKQGESLQLDVISLRQLSLKQNFGFVAPARGVVGYFELPDGFFLGDSLDRQSHRSIPFGSIYPGDASHCGPVMVTAEDTVALGTYHAKFVYWGKNVPTQEIDIELIVNP